ncbi:MAG: spore coat protein CotJB [Firmicutes bacterium]|nr:spore coat protein CotJB [Bacillota bacterium]HOB22587.1 spore coat protein CotJB [Bacillota bacterium]HQD39540.1 spore coat protein CotJB [Bacillota bacterium]
MEVKELQFSLVELNLFLDTHPTDQQALALFEQINQQLQMKVAEYEKRFGPLTVQGQKAGCSYWQWVEGPWPWEMSY